MAFQINLFNSINEKNRLSKVGISGIGTPATGTLKESCDLTHPVILISGYLGESPTFNYCHISEFNRYYFIDRIVIVRAALYEIHCTVDVLVSYKDEIVALSPYVTRWENSTETLYPDKRLPVKNSIVRTIYNSDIDSVFSNGTNAGALGIVSFSGFPIGDALPFEDEFIYNYDETDLIRHNNSYSANEHLTNLKFILQNSPTSNMFDEDSPNIEKFLNKVFKSTDGRSSILSLRVYPINILDMFTKITDRVDSDKLVTIGTLKYPWGVNATDAGDHPTLIKSSFYLGTDTETTYYGYMMTNTMETQYKVASITIPNGDWTYYSPYSKYKIWLPFYGYTELNSVDVIGSTLDVWYQIDWDTGKAIIRVINTTTNLMIFSASCIVGQDIPISQSNASEIEARKEGINASRTGGLIASAVTFIAGAFASFIPGAQVAGIGMIAGAIGSAATTAATTESATSLLLPNSDAGDLTNSAIMCSPNKPFIIKETSNVQFPTDYEQLIGKPYNQIVKLSTIKGYVEIGNVHLEGFSTALSEELDMIEQQLKSGIIL